MFPLVAALALLGGLAIAEKAFGGQKPEKRRTKRNAKKRNANRRNRLANLPRVMTSFDYDHDDKLRILLVGQAKHPDTPFQLADWSVKAHMTGDWKEKVRARIRAVDVLCVLCGEHTHTAKGVAAELEIAREEKKPYFLLQGYSDKACTKPTSALSSDKMYKWTWDNLKALIAGGR